jgi:hypothetical protein
MIRCILKASIVHYADTRCTRAHVTWIDQRKRQGETSGAYPSSHLTALLLRAQREGVTVVREEW